MQSGRVPTADRQRIPWQGGEPNRRNLAPHIAHVINNQIDSAKGAALQLPSPCRPTVAQPHWSGQISIDRKFRGAAMDPNGLVVFAPSKADGVGLFDASTKTFEMVSISGQISIDRKFDGAAMAPNGLVVFAPSKADVVGVYQAMQDEHSGGCPSVCYHGSFSRAGSNCL